MAYTRHGAVRTLTTDANYSGISATLKLPSTVSIDQTGGYVDWYLGLGATVVEAGISRTATTYKCFLGTGSTNGGVYDSKPVSLQDGGTCNLKLINNGDNTISLYLNSNLIHANFPVKPGRLGAKDVVKMVHGVEDNGKSSYSQASFSNVQLRANASGSVYVPWDGSVKSTTTKVDITAGGAKQMTTHSQVPLSTSLTSS